MSEKFKYTTGLHNAGSYQVAGVPFLTGSQIADENEEEIPFYQVTKEIKVKKTSGTGELRVHFGSLSNTALAAKGTMDFRTADNVFDIPNGSGVSVSWWLSGSDGNNTFNATENYIVLKNEAGDNSVQLRPKTQSSHAPPRGRLQIRVIDTAGNDYYNQTVSNANLYANGWNHYVLTLKGQAGAAAGSIKFYLNGSLLTTATPATSNAITGSTKFVLFNGIDYDKVVGVDEVAVWGTELTGDEVTAVYNTGGKADPRTIQGANLKLWYQFGDNENDVIDGANTIIKDSSGNSDDLNDLTNFGGSDELFPVLGPFFLTNNVYRNLHFWPLPGNGDEVTIPVKCNKVFLSASGSAIDYQLNASLTEIPSARMYELSGSGVDE